MKGDKRLVFHQVGLNVRRNCFAAFLLSLVMLVSGCGELGNIFHGKQDSERESVGSGGMGNLVIKAESNDENVVYVAEKAEDRLQVSKEYFVWGITESGSPWGIDGEGTVWGRDDLPEGFNTEEARTIYVSEEEICILYRIQNNESLVMDPQGERKGRIDFGGGTVENIVSGDYAIYRFGELGARVGVCPLDIKNLKKGENLQPLPEDTRGLLAKGSDNENLYLYTEEMVYRYSLKEGICYTVFSWVEVGLIGGSINMVWKEGDDYYAIVYEGVGTTTYQISRKSRDDVPKKREIVIASLQSDSNLSKLVVNFNQSQDEYHATIKTCQENDGVTSREAAYTRLNASLLGTDPPDLLFMQNIWYGDDLAAHGYLEDLKPFLASSEKIGIDDFYPELISYGTCGDVLYTIPYEFWIETLKIPMSEWDGYSVWTYAQMLEYLKGKSEYKPMGDFYLTKFYLLQETVGYFVDKEQGEAYFDSPDFLALLTYMKDCKEKEGMMDPDRRRIMQRAVCNRLSYFGTKDEYDGEEYAFVGYPSPDGTMRTIIRGEVEFAIVSTARNKEGAWKFMEELLSSEPSGIDLTTHELLSNRNNMQKFIEKELALYGQEYEEIIDDDGSVILLYSDHSITQAHIENFEKALAAGRKVSAMNMILGAIVYDETDAYFKGTRSAEEAVEIIQNRVKLYLAENR